MKERIARFANISSALALLSDARLSSLLDEAKAMHTGIGGKSLLLTLDGTRIFVKKVPLTDLEREPRNTFSTANLFDMPLYCQYGIGSPGFGAWREVVAHIMTTNWVTSGLCPSFPILYHWRVLPTLQPEQMNMDEWGSFEAFCKYWNDSLAVRERVEAINHSRFQILLFLEYLPETLHSWLQSQLAVGGNVAESSVQMVEHNLRVAIDFMNDHGLLHFDSHFNNILTDGKQIYLSDFGLALSSTFDLSKSEREFFNLHKSYDYCNAETNFVYTLITSAFGKGNWQLALREFLDGKRGGLSPRISTAIQKYGYTALATNEFYQQVKHAKHTPYPALRLDALRGSGTKAGSTD